MPHPSIAFDQLRFRTDTEVLNTFEAAHKALKSPELSRPGRCAYVAEDGTRCLVGQILSDLGVSDDVLQYGDGSFARNGLRFITRYDLHSVVTSANLDVTAMNHLQSMFDRERLDLLKRLVGE